MSTWYIPLQKSQVCVPPRVRGCNIVYFACGMYAWWYHHLKQNGVDGLFFGPQLSPAPIILPSIHASHIHPLINPSIHPSILLGRPDVARINPATIMHNCALLYKWSYYTKTKLVTASTYTKCRSNDQQQHFALGKKGWPRQWHHLSWGEELVEVSWESVEFLIARVVIKVPKLLHQQHAPVFLCHMYRES